RMVLAWLLDSKQQGNSHLSCIQLEHAALLHFTTYLDEDALLWPQLQGLINPSMINMTPLHATLVGRP
ncbi:MAG: hypothetical protein ACRCVV_13970, partial [Shewanella sp.]